MDNLMIKEDTIEGAVYTIIDVIYNGNGITLVSSDRE